MYDVLRREEENTTLSLRRDSEDANAFSLRMGRSIEFGMSTGED